MEGIQLQEWRRFDTDNQDLLQGLIESWRERAIEAERKVSILDGILFDYHGAAFDLMQREQELLYATVPDVAKEVVAEWRALKVKIREKDRELQSVRQQLASLRKKVGK